MVESIETSVTFQSFKIQKKMNEELRRLDKSIEKALQSQETLIGRIDFVQREVDSACLIVVEGDDPSKYTKKLRGARKKIVVVRDTIERVKGKLERVIGSNKKE